jgi:hyperosmotically inducible protein
MKPLVFSLFLVVCVFGCNKASPPSGTASTYHKPELPATTTTSEEVRKDNTTVNARDRFSNAKTPIDQNENQKDIDISASIRKRVVGEKLSSNAHNAKIITQDGKVTLRGPVASEDEKKQVEDIATDVAGAGNVDNQLEIQP